GLYCAQLGAEVIRVDQIGGGPDFHRWPVTRGNDSLYWENLNRAKKSLALDYTVNNAVGYPMMTGGGPEPVNHVLPAWDLISGAYAAFALLAAMRRRSETGAGCELRVPLSDVAIGSVANLGGIAEVLYEEKNRPRLGN